MKITYLAPNPSLQIYNCDWAEMFENLAEPVSLFFTSPPYNIGSQAPKCCLGLRKYGIFDPKSWGGIEDYPDSLPEEVYQKGQHDFLVQCCEHMAEGGAIVYNHKDRRRKHALIEPQSWFPGCLTLCDKIVWDRLSTHNHDSTHTYQQTEYLFVLRRKEDRRCYFDNVDTGDPGNRSNVWGIAFQKGKSWHNAPFPLVLAERVLRKWSPPGSLVCDPYMGSGTTAIAALRTGRKFIGSEINSQFFLKAKNRIEHEHD